MGEEKKSKYQVQFSSAWAQSFNWNARDVDTNFDQAIEWRHLDDSSKQLELWYTLKWRLSYTNLLQKIGSHVQLGRWYVKANVVRVDYDSWINFRVHVAFIWCIWNIWMSNLNFPGRWGLLGHRVVEHPIIIVLARKFTKVRHVHPIWYE